MSLADMLLAKKKSPAQSSYASNPDPKPKWNHNFVDHESLPLKDLGSINDEDDYVPPQPQGRRKSAANMTLARSLLRNKPVDKPAEEKRMSGSLANFVGKKDKAKFGTATATLSDFYSVGNEENNTPPAEVAADTHKDTHKPKQTIAEYLAAKKGSYTSGEEQPNKTISLADYYKNKAAKSSSSSSPAVNESEADEQRALWAKFGMSPPAKAHYSS
jgi:hypothetical protein